MRIAVVGAKGLPPTQGGIEHYCAGLYPRIVAQGHEVDLFARASYTERPWFSKDDFGGVNVISLPSLSLSQGGTEAVYSSAMGALASLKMDYDIVHFHALGPSLFAWLPKIASSTRVVVTCHGLDWQRQKWGNLSSSVIRMGERMAVKYAHRIVVVSETLKAYFKATYGCETNYIANAPAGYTDSDPDFNFGRSLGLEQGRYLVFLGRLVPEKCPDLLIKAFQKLRPQGWKLAMVGGASDTSGFTTELTQLAGGDSDIVFTGPLQGSRLAEIVRGAGLFVLPSNLEGMPLALLEAMQEGIPAIASDIPPLQQLLNNGRGLIFQAGNLDSCIQCLDRAIQYPDEMTLMAERAREYVKRFHSWDTVAADNLRLYEDLLIEHKAPTLSIVKRPSES